MQKTNIYFLALQLIVLVLYIFFIATTVEAVVVKDLYEASVPVSNHSIAVRNQALQKALKEVLIKISGNGAIIQIPTISNAVNGNASEYINEYNYKFIDNKNYSMLHIHFIKNMIDKLLLESGQLVFGENRPLTLVWIVVRDYKGFHLLGYDDSPCKILQQDATRLGLPIIFPILDLSSIVMIRASDIWPPLLSVIKRASARYAPDAILINYVDMRKSSHVIGHWLLLFRDVKVRWEVEGGSFNEVVDIGLNNIASVLAQQFAVVAKSTKSNKIILIVTELHGVNAYAKVINYLNRLNVVKKVNVIDVTKQSASFELELTSGIVKLIRALSLTNLFKPIFHGNDNDNMTEGLTLRYYYQGR